MLHIKGVLSYPAIVVGNKCDLDQRRAVSTERKADTYYLIFSVVLALCCIRGQDIR